jgi:acyl-CoA thioesterase
MFTGDGFVTHNGIRVEAIEPGIATAAVDVTDKHRNLLGMIQGGLVFTLADFAFGVLANSEHEVPTVTLSGNINYLKAAKGNTLTAIAKYANRGRTISVVNVEIYDELGTHAASAVFTGFTMR